MFLLNLANNLGNITINHGSKMPYYTQRKAFIKKKKKIKHLIGKLKAGFGGYTHLYPHILCYFTCPDSFFFLNHFNDNLSSAAPKHFVLNETNLMHMLKILKIINEKEVVLTSEQDSASVLPEDE